MINVQKITNKDDGFLISFYTAIKQEVYLVDGNNIVAELNKAFKAIEEANQQARNYNVPTPICQQTEVKVA